MAQHRERVMVTGMRNPPPGFFDLYYAPAIRAAHARGAKFLIGAADGIDFRTSMLLEMLGAKDVTIYDKGDSQTLFHWPVINGFKSYPERDRKMVLDSDKIIVYLYGNTAGSGTFANLVDFATHSLLADIVRFPQDERLPELQKRIPLMTTQLARIFDRTPPYDSGSWELDFPGNSVIDFRDITVQPEE